MASCAALECPICRQSLMLNPRSSTSTTSPLPNDDLIPIPDEVEPSLPSGGSDSGSGGRYHSGRWYPVCTPCGHVFHRGCITEWFRVRRNHDGGRLVRCPCPTCRKLISYHKLIRIYLPSNSTAPEETPRVSVTEAVRRYHDQHLIEPVARSIRRRTISEPTTTSSNSGDGVHRIYNDFFTLFRRFSENDTLQSGFISGGTSSSSSAVVEGLMSCDNQDCVALRNVYEVLSRECRCLQRKLDVEVDASKMKSILVAGLQRELDCLRHNKPTLNTTQVASIFLLSFLCFWISACLALVAF